MATQGAHHVGLTVRDVEAASAFFCEALGFQVVGGRPDYPAVFVSDGAVMLTLWQAADPDNARAFDRRGCVGLHHLALRVAEGVALDDLHRRLAARSDVQIEFPPEALGAGGLRHMMLAGPSGLRLELVEVPS